jgi:hypothetical protein
MRRPIPGRSREAFPSRDIGGVRRVKSGDSVEGRPLSPRIKTDLEEPATVIMATEELTPAPIANSRVAYAHKSMATIVQHRISAAA